MDLAVPVLFWGYTYKWLHALNNYHFEIIKCKFSNHKTQTRTHKP